MKTGLPAAAVTASVKRSSRAIASMFRAAGSGTAGALPGNAVRRQRPALAAQRVGDRGVTAERADPGVECFRRRLSHIPMWNQRQSIGRLSVFPIQLAGQQLVAALKNPASQADGG